MSSHADLVVAFTNLAHAADQAHAERDRARNLAAALWDEQCQEPVDCQPAVDSQQPVDSPTGNTP